MGVCRRATGRPSRCDLAAFAVHAVGAILQQLLQILPSAKRPDKLNRLRPRMPKSLPNQGCHAHEHAHEQVSLRLAHELLMGSSHFLIRGTSAPRKKGWYQRGTPHLLHACEGTCPRGFFSNSPRLPRPGSVGRPLYCGTGQETAALHRRPARAGLAGYRSVRRNAADAGRTRRGDVAAPNHAWQPVWPFVGSSLTIKNFSAAFGFSARRGRICFVSLRSTKPVRSRRLGRSLLAPQDRAQRVVAFRRR